MWGFKSPLAHSGGDVPGPVVGRNRWSSGTLMPAGESGERDGTRRSVILRRDSAPRRALDPVDPTSVPDLARLHRGRAPEEASAACGLPVGQLEDFEAGTVSRLPDRVAVLKGLRRYAD